MDNVYDIKRLKNLNYILPLKQRLDRDAGIGKLGKVAVIVHLYYMDTVDFYLEYIEALPAEVDVYFTVSNSELREILQKKGMDRRKNCRIIEKSNRGRDVSAFLVACRREILKYEYVCFLHDKKEKKAICRRDNEIWVRCLWENMVGSRDYIHNIFLTFHNNPQLGLLVPPLPLSEHCPISYEDTWYEDFEATRGLAEKMNLNCDLDRSKPPITLGTVFWARVCALRKILESEWTYEDFDEEPLKNDGTVSHGVERILAYVAQDAGFETGWAMSDRYAGEYFEYVQLTLKKAFGRLEKSLGIWTISGLDHYEREAADLMEFAGRHEKLYIYGAGALGKSCLAVLESRHRKPDAFLVSGSRQDPEKIGGIPVLTLDRAGVDRTCGIIVCVSEGSRKEVMGMIEEKSSGFSNVYIYYDFNRI